VSKSRQKKFENSFSSIQSKAVASTAPAFSGKEADHPELSPAGNFQDRAVFAFVPLKTEHSTHQRVPPVKIGRLCFTIRNSLKRSRTICSFYFILSTSLKERQKRDENRNRK
jgi:hypothetical protein